MPKLIDLEKIKPIDFPSTEMDGLDVVRYLNTLPTVDAAEMTHGRWLKAKDGFDIDRGWKCSGCNNYVYAMTYEPYEYCPHCGATMDGERKNNG